MAREFEANRIQQISHWTDEGSITGVWKDIVNFSGSGNNIIITPLAGCQRGWRIKKLLFAVGGITNIQLYSGTTPISGLIPLGTYGSLALDGEEFGLVAENATDNFIINSSNAVQIGGWIRWTEI